MHESKLATCYASQKRKVFSWWHKWGANIMNLIRIAGLALVASAVLVEPGLAQYVAGVPGPIVGVGLPALVLIGGAYWVGRKLFGRNEESST
jgi:hypothetical protein